MNFIWNLSYEFCCTSWIFFISFPSKAFSSLFSFRLDYVGIVILIVCSFPAWLHYAFLCSMKAQIFYTTLIIVLGLLCSYAVLDDRFNHRDGKHVRAGNHDNWWRCCSRSPPPLRLQFPHSVLASPTLACFILFQFQLGRLFHITLVMCFLQLHTKFLITEDVLTRCYNDT